MDGYALRSADAAEIGSVLTVIGQAAAGHAFTGTVGEGQAVRIFTGAPVPQGADTVLIQEDAEVLEGGKSAPPSTSPPGDISARADRILPKAKRP